MERAKAALVFCELAALLHSVTSTDVMKARALGQGYPVEKREKGERTLWSISPLPTTKGKPMPWWRTRRAG